MSRGRAGRSQQQLDRILQAQCHGEAWRRITAGEPLTQVVAAIRELAGNRAHLLVEEAGTVAGSWAARPTALGTELIVAATLIQAAGTTSPINPHELHHWIHQGWTRATTPNHTAS